MDKIRTYVCFLCQLSFQNSVLYAIIEVEGNIMRGKSMKDYQKAILYVYPRIGKIIRDIDGMVEAQAFCCFGTESCETGRGILRLCARLQRAHLFPPSGAAFGKTERLVSARRHGRGVVYGKFFPRGIHDERKRELARPRFDDGQAQRKRACLHERPRKSAGGMISNFRFRRKRDRAAFSPSFAGGRENRPRRRRTRRACR